MSETITGAEESLEPAALAAKLGDERPADIVEVLNEHLPQVTAAVLSNLPPDTAIAVLDTPSLDHAAEIIEAIPRDRVVALLTGMAADRVADLFRELADPVRSDLMARLDAETQASVRQLLAYPEESAGSLMTTEFVSVPSNWTAAQALQHVRMVERTRETIYALFILDPRSKVLLRALPLRRLISADPEATVLGRRRRHAAPSPYRRLPAATRRHA